MSCFSISEGVSNICSTYNIVQYILFITDQTDQTLQHQSEEFSGVLIIFLFKYKTENRNMFNVFRLKRIFIWKQNAVLNENHENYIFDFDSSAIQIRFWWFWYEIGY